MPQISRQYFERLPLRVHEFLAGIPLHDAWVVTLPKTREGITLARFLNASNGDVFRPSALVRFLLGLRFAIGGVFGWDRNRVAAEPKTFADRLTVFDRAKSLVPAGTRKGRFRIVYRFENEELAELVNATVHGAALSALVETDTSYRYYLGVYVAPVTCLTPVYMALIDPVRRLFVYPSLLRGIRTNWNHAFGVGHH